MHAPHNLAGHVCTARAVQRQANNPNPAWAKHKTRATASEGNAAGWILESVPASISPSEYFGIPPGSVTDGLAFHRREDLF